MSVHFDSLGDADVAYDGRPRVGFLFNHEQMHQIPHAVTILNALAADSPDIDVHAFVSGQKQAEFLLEGLTASAAKRIRLHRLRPPALMRAADLALGHAAPLKRIGTLFRYRRQLAEMDVLVAPETTSILLKTRFGCHRPCFVYTQHGAGDRAVGFKPIIRHYDHVLLPGDKIRDRMVAENIVPQKGFSEVGYPKFDFIDMSARRDLFGNGRPTVLYNPHFHPALSSWFRDGLKVLDFFLENEDFNLIFAPHVMLFSRRLHVSLGPLRAQWRSAVPRRYLNRPNILIDTGSSASVDMTYTRAADIYLGDVSSQVYEFIHEPKPCIFLNSHDVDWASNANYRHWHLGAVIGSIEGLGPLLSDPVWHENGYRALQDRAFRETFGDSVKGGAVRAAAAIKQLAFAHYAEASLKEEAVSAAG